MFTRVCVFLLVCYFPVVQANEQVIDPLGSPSWKIMHEILLNNEPVVFDNNVQVSVPDFAEDPLNVPVTLTVNGLKDVKNIILFADLNPIQQIVNLQPASSSISFSFRFKVEQSTPVRAAVKTGDGVWHVGGRWVDAAGGGCTVSSMGMAEGTWPDTLMNVSSRYWSRTDHNRLRFKIMHPMDTGLAPGIPAFFIEDLILTDANDVSLATLQVYQPISENPVFTIDLNKEVEMPFSLSGRDNNGNTLDVKVVH